MFLLFLLTAFCIHVYIIIIHGCIIIMIVYERASGKKG